MTSSRIPRATFSLTVAVIGAIWIAGAFSGTPLAAAAPRRGVDPSTARTIRAQAEQYIDYWNAIPLNADQQRVKAPCCSECTMRPPAAPSIWPRAPGDSRTTSSRKMATPRPLGSLRKEAHQRRRPCLTKRACRRIRRDSDDDRRPGWRNGAAAGYRACSRRVSARRLSHFSTPSSVTPCLPGTPIRRSPRRNST